MTHNPTSKHREMTQAPIGPLILHLAAPCIISMLVSAFYNMADTFFVGQLNSNSATGAVGVVFSLMAVIQALGFFFGQGSGNFISRALGRQDLEEAEKMASTGFFSSLAAGCLICLLGQIFQEPLAHFLGATPTILPYAKSYMRVILLGAPWMISSMVLNNQLRFEGSAFYGMIGIAGGAVLNIVLDPIFIFYMDLGVAGAAWATIISQFISFCLLLGGTMRSGNLRIRISRFQPKASYYHMIFQGGLPSLARQGLASVATICLNQAAGNFGDAAIAAMSVVQRIVMFGASAMIGFGQGFQPVCGFCYGAGLYERVKKGFWFCVKFSTGFLLAMACIGYILAPQLIALFRDDPDVIAFGTLAFRLQCITFAFHGWIVMSNMMMQTIGKTVPATFLAVARQGFFFIPLVLILSRVWGAFGIQITQGVADSLTLLCAIPLQLFVLRELTDSHEHT